MNKKAFTLIEVLAVIILLGVISIIAVPSVKRIIEKSRQTSLEADKNTVKDAANIFVNDCIYNNMCKDNNPITDYLRKVDFLTENKYLDKEYNSDWYFLIKKNKKGEYKSVLLVKDAEASNKLIGLPCYVQWYVFNYVSDSDQRFINKQNYTILPSDYEDIIKKCENSNNKGELNSYVEISVWVNDYGKHSFSVKSGGYYKEI